MAGGWDHKRLLRIALISGVLMAAFILLEPYGLSWAVIPGGLAVAVIILLAALWQNHRTKRKLAELRREIEEMQRRDGG